MKRALLVFFCVTASGCFPFDDTLAAMCDAGTLNCPVEDAGEPARPDGGPDLDGGDDVDSGTPDAGTPDAGTVDGGDDAGTPDAGDDAGTPDGGDDAGTPDAGDDAGTPDAGHDAGTPFTFDAGVYCKGAWCWNNPSQLPGVALAAIWGTSDTDVWVAGGSGVVAHFDGTRWASASISAQLSGLINITSAAIDGNGQLYLCGRDTPAVGFSGDTLISPAFSGQNLCGAVDWWNQQSVFASLSVLEPSYELPDIGSPTPLTLPSDNTAIYRHTSVRIDADGTVAFIEYGDNNYTIARSDGTRARVLRDDGGVVPYVTALRRDPSGVLHALAFDGSETATLGTYDSLNQRWTAIDRVNNMRLWDAMAEQLPGGATQWFYGGQNGYLGASSETGPIRPLAPLDYNFGATYAVWQSPAEKTFWAAGEGGQVLRVSRLPDGGFGPRTIASQAMQQTIQDLWVTGPNWFAAGDNGTVWTEKDGGWNPVSGFSGASIISYIRTPRGSVTLHEDRRIRLGDGGVVGSQLPALPTLYVRNGGVAVMPDGGFITAWGTNLYGSSNYSTYSLLGFSEFSHMTDVVVGASGQVWASAVSGDEIGLVDGGVITWNVGNISTPTLFSGEPVYAVALATDGGIFALAEDDVLRCSEVSCTSLGGTGSGYRPVSLWVDAQNRVWILNEKGQVCWGDPAQGLTCDPELWSGGEYNERLPTRIRGTADRVFVVGGFGGIISRPLPP